LKHQPKNEHNNLFALNNLCLSRLLFIERYDVWHTTFIELTHYYYSVVRRLCRCGPVVVFLYITISHAVTRIRQWKSVQTKRPCPQTSGQTPDQMCRKYIVPTIILGLPTSTSENIFEFIIKLTENR